MNTIKNFIAIMMVLFLANNSIAQTYTMHCNEEPVKVLEQNDVPLSYGVNTYKYARVTYDGKPLKLEVEVSGFKFNDSDWDISPHNYKIKAEKKGNKLSFTIDRKGYLVIRFKKNQDFTKRLVVFIEEPEVIPEGELVDITKIYGVDNTGSKNETEKIQLALDEISGTGKILYFPEGIYKSFMLRIKSNSRIHIAGNARIKADASAIESYLVKGDKGINRFIFIENAENIQVTGLGAFDANGSELLGVNPPDLAERSKSIRCLFIYKSKNIIFDGTILKDPAGWNTHVMGCEDVTFKNCKILNNTMNNEFFGSLDGWDPDGSKRVLIEDCFGWAGDDNVAVKCTGYGNFGVYFDVEDVTVRRCVFLTKKTSLKIGTETRCENYKRIRFEDIDIIEADRAMGVNVRDRAIVDGVLFKDVRVEYSYPDRKQMPINVYITRREDDQPWTGKIRNLTFENCSFDQMFPEKIQLFRIESHTVKDDLQLKFKNLTIENKKVKSLSPDFFNVDRCNGLIEFK